MEVILSVGLIAVTLSNIWMIFSLKKSRGVEILPVLESKVDCYCGAEFVNEIKALLVPLIEASTPKAPPVPDESHKAWKNQKEEPKAAPPSPHGPPPVPGPLERPYGFSR